MTNNPPQRCKPWAGCSLDGCRPRRVQRGTLAAVLLLRRQLVALDDVALLRATSLALPVREGGGGHPNRMTAMNDKTAGTRTDVGLDGGAQVREPAKDEDDPARSKRVVKRPVPLPQTSGQRPSWPASPTATRRRGLTLMHRPSADANLNWAYWRRPSLQERRSPRRQVEQSQDRCRLRRGVRPQDDEVTNVN